MAATALTPPLLDLSTLATPPTIVIDNVAYPLALPDNLALLDYKRLSVILPVLETLWAKAATSPTALTAAEERDLGNCFRGVCRIVLGAPEAVQVKLSDMQRVAIYQAFLKLPLGTLQRVGALMRSRQTPTAAQPTSTSTGATSSRASRTRTPASARSHGSRKSRSASSAPIS
jgi:hypothetical protein